MKIAFVANGQKCQFFDLIGKSIKEKNNSIEIYWICILKQQRDYLLSNGYCLEDVLFLDWDIHKKGNKAIGEYKLNELISADRRLKYHFKDGLSYLVNLQSPFESFVKGKQIQYIFGETTWAHEILMKRICQDKFENQCYYLHPQSIRIPNGRFTFMDTEFQDSIAPQAERIYPKLAGDEKVLPIKPVVPERVADVAKDVRRTLTLTYPLKRLLAYFIFRTSPPPVYKSRPFYVNFWFFFKDEANKLYYTKFLRKSTISDLEGKNFFFITLHMQPEASVDVVGRYYEDQFQLIKNVWRILPNDYYLVIKEHTNAIGNRGRKFFKQCLNLRNVIILNENERSHQVLSMAQAVFTNSGTIALEGALFGKDVFVFSRIFFDKISNCHKISLEELKYTANFFELLEYCKEKDKNKMSILDYSKYILSSSFAGVIDPHDGSLYYTDKNNIDTIANSFIDFLQR